MYQLISYYQQSKKRRAKGELKFDRVMIETTGMADPAPVAQTFFADEKINERYLLDAVVTVVDAKHGLKQLEEFTEAQQQAVVEAVLRYARALVEDGLHFLHRVAHEHFPRAAEHQGDS